MIDISIPSTTQVGNYTVYNIEIRVDISNAKSYVYTSSKRFSDFFHLRNQIGLDYALPSRLSVYYKTQKSVLDTRRESLLAFVKFLFADEKLLMNSLVLQFFNVSKAAILEDKMISGTKESKTDDGAGYFERKDLKTNHVVDSPQKWMQQCKLMKSTLQDARNKIFSNSNIVEIKGILKSVETNVRSLALYLNSTSDISDSEILKRKELLLALQTELQELQTLSSSIQPVTKASITDSELLSTNSAKGRTLGKPKETQSTRQLSNTGLLQSQKQIIHSQDQELEGLRDLIVRQKQMGLAINEELSIQNELLSNFGDKIDESEKKMTVAKNKINKIT